MLSNAAAGIVAPLAEGWRLLFRVLWPLQPMAFVMLSWTAVLCRYGKEIYTPNLGIQLALFGVAAVTFLRCGALHVSSAARRLHRR